MKTIIILLAAPLLVVFYAIATAGAPRTKEEREYADREQTEFLEKWSKEHPGMAEKAYRKKG